MNRYDHQFAAVCPSDGATIIYHLTIKIDAVIMVERLIEACQFPAPAFHEGIADELARKLGGRQKLRALHQGVQITTTRDDK
jgi:hypothetical protein